MYSFKVGDKVKIGTFELDQVFRSPNKEKVTMHQGKVDYIGKTLTISEIHYNYFYQMNETKDLLYFPKDVLQPALKANWKL